MDFTPDLSAFQGVIISADNVYSFSKLKNRGGNEEKIDYIVSSLLYFCKELKYVVNNQLAVEKLNEMRKFAFFIILNADIPTLEEMVEKEGIDVVIWTVPTISKCLMCEIMWNLYMDKYVLEIIAFCYPQLALEVASAFLDNIKYCSPSESLQKLKIITTALYRLSCRLHFFKYENNVISELSNSAFNIFQLSVNYFVNPPKSGKLDRLTKDDQYKHKGNCFDTMLAVICECLTQFTTIQEFAPVEFDQIYLMTYQIGTYTDDALGYNMCNSPNKTILDLLDRCNIILLDKCKELLMEISVDIFCAWSEFEEFGKNMQQAIGEHCYKLRTKLLSIPSLSEHPIVEMIQQISRKPAELKEIINASENTTIIKNINSANKSAWISALICKDELCSNEDLVNELASNLDSLNEDECHKLYRTCMTYLNDYTENTQNVEILAIKAFNNCNFETKNEIVTEHFPNNCFFDKETKGFNNAMTEVFNKVIVIPETDVILSLFLQSPQKVFTKMFLLAAENSQQTEIMLKAMRQFQKYSNYYYSHETEPCIIRITRDILDNSVDTDAKRKNFVRFINGLKNYQIIPGAKLLLLITMPSLHKALLNKDKNAINIQCHLLSEAFQLDELLVYRAPMLAMLAQILDAVRWKINTYTPLDPSTLQSALQLQIALWNTYNEGIPEKEANWLKIKMKHVQPLNLYYYRKLWNPPGENLVEVVTGMKLNAEMNIEPLAAWLSQVLCSCTQKEWCDIWDSLHEFGDFLSLDMIHKALCLLTAAEVANREENTWACLLNCFKNFVFIIKFKFFNEPLSNSQVLEANKKIALIANLLKEDNIDDYGTVIMPLLAYIFERKSDYSINVLKILCNNQKHATFVNIAKKVFGNTSNTDA